MLARGKFTLDDVSFSLKTVSNNNLAIRIDNPIFRNLRLGIIGQFHVVIVQMILRIIARPISFLKLNLCRG